MTNNLILKVKKIQVHGKLTEIQVKDGRKVLAQIFPCYNFKEEIIYYEISIQLGSRVLYQHHFKLEDDPFEYIRKKIDNYYNIYDLNDSESCKARNRDRIKKNFGAGPVYVSYEGKEI